MKLSDLKQGDKAIIYKIHGSGAFKRRIMEMGFVAGKQIELIKFAPLKDPVEYSIMGYEVSLRLEESKLVEIVPIDKLSENLIVDYHGTIQSNSKYKNQRHFSNHIKIAFVGNPNCGKTTIFNQVTGLHEKVGNYSGVTVDAKTSHYKRGNIDFEITDLPGTYSLTAYSPEELYVREFILKENPDVVVNIIDSSNLERNMYLTTQLIDMDIKVVGALNMHDELLKNGDKLDHIELSKLLGIPLIPTIGKSGKGVDELFDKIIDVHANKDAIVRHIHINYGKTIEKGIQNIQSVLKIPDNLHLTNKISSRFLSIKLLEDDAHIKETVGICENRTEIYEKALESKFDVEEVYRDGCESAITDAKYGFIHGALKETFNKNSKQNKRVVTKVIDDIITNKLYSFPLFIFLMWIMFQSTFFIGSFPQAWLSWLIDQFGILVAHWMPDGMARDLIVDGIIGGVGGVIVFLPNILILFFFISLMEDTGYMARVAFIVDKLMHRVGLHGRSFIPLLMGFGCNVPAIMATRTIEGKNDRLTTILITPFMSCSARLPVYILIISAFFPKYPGTMLFFIYTLGIMMAALMAIIFKKTLLKAKELPFVMELPPYRIPTSKTILKHMWFKAEMYLKKMSGVIMIASIIIWALNYFPRDIEYTKDYKAEIQNIENQYSQKINTISSPKDTLSLHLQKIEKLHSIEKEMNYEKSEKSLIGQIGHFIEPVIRPMGFDWRMGVSLLTGIAAKEIIISTMGVLYQSDATNNATVDLGKKLQNATIESGPRKGEKVFNKNVAFAFILFILFYFPCVAVFSTVRREAGGWKYATFMAFYTTALAWIFAFASFQIGSLF